MGIGGNFWDLLKPHARFEGFDFLKNKRVAVDLSYWIVQHETAIKGYTRKPHIRLTFFRTINLFSKFGAYPVFVVDGTPSPLKSQARIARFFRSSGIEPSNLPEAEEGVSVERNSKFRKCVQECVELLELLGMPVLKAKGEAEALCAELNREGYVDACVTSDSDAFLYGAKCVIKRIQPNSKEPFECYHISDIEAGLGLKRNHLIAISLLVGSDHDLGGVPGIGMDKAVRFAKHFSEDQILIKLHDIGDGADPFVIHENIGSVNDAINDSSEKSAKTKVPHCSHCGHPGNKKAHLKFSCELCNSTAGASCWQKRAGFKCDCFSCESDRKEKEMKKKDNWRLAVCRMIASQEKFPNDEIIGMYLRNHHGIDDDPIIGWATPQVDMLVDYLSYQQQWEPSYIRQRLLPMLSTIYLRDMASNPTNNLFNEQYEFHNVHRVKIRYGHECYVVNWKKAVISSNNIVYTIPDDSDSNQDYRELDESNDMLEEPDVPHIHIDNGNCFLSTDEDMELVRMAFPEKVGDFLKQQELKAMKSRKKKSNSEKTPETSGPSTSRSQQLSIKEFYRSSKATCQNKPQDNAEGHNNISPAKRKEPSTPLSKSTRRKLLFG